LKSFRECGNCLNISELPDENELLRYVYICNNCDNLNVVDGYENISNLMIRAITASNDEESEGYQELFAIAFTLRQKGFVEYPFNHRG